MLPNIKSPQLSKPEATGTQTPSWTEWRKKKLGRNQGGLQGPVLLW